MLILSAILLCSGIASWFNPSRAYSTRYVCAMNVAPIGLGVRIVNVDNGRSATCLVVGTGPFVPGRVLDVAPAVRDELRFDGLTHVRVYRIR